MRGLLTQKHSKGHNRAQRAQTQVCERAQKGAKERVRVKIANIGPAKNHPWILTTLGCPGTSDPRNSQAEESLGRGLLGLSLEGWSISPQGGAQELFDRNSSGQGFPGIQGWWESKGGSWPAQKQPGLKQPGSGTPDMGGGVCSLTVAALCSWTTFAYSSLRCWLDVLSHCNQRSSTVSKEAQKHNCKQRSSIVRRKLPIVSKTPHPKSYVEHFLTGGGGMEWGVCDICVASACADAGHTWHMPSLKVFCGVKIKAHCVIGASCACHKEKTYPALRSPPFKSARICFIRYIRWYKQHEKGSEQWPDTP